MLDQFRSKLSSHPRNHDVETPLCHGARCGRLKGVLARRLAWWAINSKISRQRARPRAGYVFLRLASSTHECCGSSSRNCYLSPLLPSKLTGGRFGLLLLKLRRAAVILTANHPTNESEVGCAWCICTTCWRSSSTSCNSHTVSSEARPSPAPHDRACDRPRTPAMMDSKVIQATSTNMEKGP